MDFDSQLNKTDKLLIRTIGLLTLRHSYKWVKISVAELSQHINKSERTTQRSLKKIETLKLISREQSSIFRTSWKIVIASDFYLQIKPIWQEFEDQEKNDLNNVTHQSKSVTPNPKNVTPRTINTQLENNNKTSNTYLNGRDVSKINKNSVSFFISEEILNCDLKFLDQKIGLTYSDLQSILNQTGWRIEDIQNSINNYSEALETKTFEPKKSPREAFISILTGNGKIPPRLFNRPSNLIKLEKELEEKKAIQAKIDLENVTLKNEQALIEESKQNYWLSLSDLKKQDYLNRSDNDLNKAIELAFLKMHTEHEEFSLSKILQNLENSQELENCNSKKNQTRKEFPKIQIEKSKLEKKELKITKSKYHDFSLEIARSFGLTDSEIENLKKNELQIVNEGLDLFSKNEIMNLQKKTGLKNNRNIFQSLNPLNLTRRQVCLKTILFPRNQSFN